MDEENTVSRSLHTPPTNDSLDAPRCTLETPMPLKDLLTTLELAQWLQLNVSTLKHWRGRGEGPPWVMVGAAVRYRAADVEGWLGDCRCSATPLTRSLLTPPIEDPTSKVLFLRRECSDSSK